MRQESIKLLSKTVGGELAAEIETSSANDYNNWANECSANTDSVSKNFLKH